MWLFQFPDRLVVTQDIVLKYVGTKQSQAQTSASQLTRYPLIFFIFFFGWTVFVSELEAVL